MSLDPEAVDWLWLFRTSLRVLRTWFSAPKEVVSKPCILIVEDDKFQREVLKYYVRSIGYEPNAVSTAEAGLALLREKNHSIVFVDVRLPLMNGLELVKEVKKISKKIHVVILAGYAGDLVDLAYGTYVGLILKPFDESEIREAIEKTKI